MAENYKMSVIKSAQTRGKKFKIELQKDFLSYRVVEFINGLQRACYCTPDLIDALHRYTDKCNGARYYDGINYIETSI